MPHALRIKVGPNMMLEALLVVAYQVLDTGGSGHCDVCDPADAIVWQFIKGSVIQIIC